MPRFKGVLTQGLWKEGCANNALAIQQSHEMSILYKTEYIGTRRVDFFVEDQVWGQ